MKTNKNFRRETFKFYRSSLLKFVPYIFLFSCLFIFAACNSKKQEVIGENEFYVCSMDPQVAEKQAGLCPICKMPLAKTTIDKSEMQFIKLNDEQMLLGNIKVDSALYSFIGRESTLTGIFSIDQNKTEQVSARINGRIEQLHYKILGEQVNVGDKLYDLYSRDLLLAQEEYLLLLEKSEVLSDNDHTVLASSINKLLLAGLNESQIKELETTKQAKITNTIYSKVEGVITEIPLKEGDYVNEGTGIYKFANLSSLWVETQLYSNELKYLEEGYRVEVVAEAFPNEHIFGTVFFANPELQEKSKINIIRIEVNNVNKLFKPGMQAYVILKSEVKKSIVLPLDAVLQNAHKNIVWIEKEKGKFEARTVTIGIQNKNKVEITSGLKLGENVVVAGAYLLNSEYVFKRGVTPLEMKTDKNHVMKM